MLRTVGEKERENWKDHLPHVLHAYNCTKHKATGFSPYYLLYGRHPRLPVDILFGLITDEGTETNGPRGYAEKWAGKMIEAYRSPAQKEGHTMIKGAEVWFFSLGTESSYAISVNEGGLESSDSTGSSSFTS